MSLTRVSGGTSTTVTADRIVVVASGSNINTGYTVPTGRKATIYAYGNQANSSQFTIQPSGQAASTVIHGTTPAIIPITAGTSVYNPTNGDNVFCYETNA